MNNHLLAQLVQPCKTTMVNGVPVQTCGWADVNSLISTIVNYMLYIVVPLATLMVIYGGVMLLISGGDPKKISQGKSIITAAIVGIVIVYGSVVLYNIVKGLILGHA